MCYGRGKGRREERWGDAVDWAGLLGHGERLKMYFVGMFGSAIMGQMMRGGILAPNER